MIPQPAFIADQGDESETRRQVATHRVRSRQTLLRVAGDLLRSAEVGGPVVDGDRERLLERVRAELGLD
jgi:hypothetical protein